MNLKGNLTSKGLQGSIGKSRMQGILGTNPAAIPISVDNALSLSSTNPVQNKVITAAITNRLWSDEVKTALLQIAQKVAYIDADGQDYYDALYDALYPPTNLDSIGAVFDSSATIYNTDTLDDLKQYLTVTAYYTDGTSETVTTYTLSGLMDAGTQTITVSYGGKTTTFTVTITALEVESIDAVFTQSGTIYTTDTLNTLKQYLTVTATYSDSTTAVVTDYTLSGTLGEGTRTITVSYGGKTDTFTAVCTPRGYLYHFEQSLASSGSLDFGFSSSHVEYTTGKSGTGYAYYRPSDKDVDPDATSSYAIKAVNLTTVPDFSGDFTISAWAKASNMQLAILCAYKSETASTTNVTNAISTATVTTGWTVGYGTSVSARYKGCRFQTLSSKFNITLFAADNTDRATVVLTPPESFDITTWHHYAITRKNGTIRFFIDGSVICSFSYSKALYFAPQICVGSVFSADNSTPTATTVYTNTAAYDDYYITDYCKWSEAFDPAQIAY